MKVGDLVRYECLQTHGIFRIGIITDAMEEASGHYMYEVICTDPYERNWLSDLTLEVLSESR
jgi:hypothetical protein